MFDMGEEPSLRFDPEFNAFLVQLKRTAAALEAAMRESEYLTRRDTEEDRRSRSAA